MNSTYHTEATAIKFTPQSMQMLENFNKEHYAA